MSSVPFVLNTGKKNLKPNTVEVTWGSYALTDNGSGALSGTGGTGTVDYLTGYITVTPAVFVDNGSTVYLSATQVASTNTRYTNSIADVLALSSSGVITFQFPPGTKPGTISVTNFYIHAPDTDNIIPYEDLGQWLPKRFFASGGGSKIYDNGQGGWENLTNSDGSPRAVVGSINYSTGVATLNTGVVVPSTSFRNFAWLTKEISAYVNGSWVTNTISYFGPAETYTVKSNLTWRLYNSYPVDIACYQSEVLAAIVDNPFLVTGIPGPAVFSYSPSPVIAGVATTITITGANLGATTAVSIDGVACTGVSATAYTVSATTTISSAGSKSVVLTPAVSSTPNIMCVAAAYNQPPPDPIIPPPDPTPLYPTVTSITPNHGEYTGGETIVIAGTYLSGATATIGGISCGPVSSTSVSLTVTTPSSTVGAKDVVVTNSDGSITIDDGFVFENQAFPTIASITPNYGPVTGTNGIVITGTSMTGATVKIGETACTTVSSGSTSVTINFPASDSGRKDVIVTNSSGEAVQPRGFTVNLLEPITIEREVVINSDSPAVSVDPSGLVSIDTDTLIEYQGEYITARLKPDSTITANYTFETTEYLPVTVTAPMPNLQFRLSWSAGDMVTNSFRATIGTRTYYDIYGKLYYDINPATGVGTESGTLDVSTRSVVLTDWPSVSNTMTVTGRSELINKVPSVHITFRTPSAPVAVGSFSFRVGLYGYETTILEGSADSTGEISGSVIDPRYNITTTYCYGRFDFQTGVAEVYFGVWVTATGKESEPWFNADAVRDDGLVLWPRAVNLETMLYNCVTYSTLPLDSSIIGLDPVRLPADGRVPVFKDGQLVLVHNTQVISENSLSPTQVIDCERVRLYRVAITDANDVALSPEQYTLDRTLGTVTMKPTLDLTGLTGPYSIAHTVADLSVISDADLSGRLNLTKAVSHTYPADTSYVSGVLYAGTLQARVTSLFVQSTWTSVWQDTLIGTEPLAQFNDTQYPIQLTNAGAYPDRILIKFTSSTAFQVIGENLGLIGIGDTSTDCSPLNSLTGVAYFTIPYLGWGLGWATGNCLRFNVISAAYPIDLIRAIQPSDPSGLDADSVQLLLIGNIDA